MSSSGVNTLSNVPAAAAPPPTASPVQRARPHLLAWDAVPSSSCSSCSSPSSSLPVLSPQSQAFDDVHSPHSKSLWQLSQSEPAISLEEEESDRVTLASPGKRKKTGAPAKVPENNDMDDVIRVNGLHVSIPMQLIGHTKTVSDEEPVLLFGDDARRGRSRARNRMEQSPQRRSMSNGENSILSAPLYIVCQASTDATCPNGTSCPYADNHIQPPPPKPRHPSRTREIQALAEEFNALTRSIVSKPISLPSKALSHRSPTPPKVYSPPPLLQPAPLLDSLGLPPHPLVPTMDFAQYTRSSVVQQVEKPSVPVPVSEPEAPRVVRVIKKRQTTNLLEDLLFSPPVPVQPDPRTLYDSAQAKDVPAQLRSPPMSPEDQRSLPQQTLLSGKPTRGVAKGGALFVNAVAGLSFEKEKSKVEKAVEPTPAPTGKGPPQGFGRSQGMFSKPMFTPLSSAAASRGLSMFTTAEPAEKDGATRRASHSSKSSRSSNQPTNDPVSPTSTSRATESDATSRTTQTTTAFNQPSFTSPIRPLFSGYDRVIPDLAAPAVDENVRRGAEEWLQRQREKDLRQALRLEKALEEKRVGLVKRLEWKAPMVETGKGYGYGDGMEVQMETKLPTGEVFKVLSWEERLAMEREVKRAEESLVNVREDIVKNGGEAGQPISYEGSNPPQQQQQVAPAKSSESVPAPVTAPTPNVSTPKDPPTSSASSTDISQPPALTFNLLTPKTPETNVTEKDAENMPNSQNKGKGRMIPKPQPPPQQPATSSMPPIGLPPQMTEQQKAEKEHLDQQRAQLLTKLRASGHGLGTPNGGRKFLEAYIANASQDELVVLEQTVPNSGLQRPDVMMPSLSPPRRIGPEHLTLPPSTRYEPYPGMKKVTVEGKRAAEQRAIQRVADAMKATEEKAKLKEIPILAVPSPSSQQGALLKLLTEASPLGTKATPLTEQSMKRHEKRIPEEEKCDLKETQSAIDLASPPKVKEKELSPSPREKSLEKKPVTQQPGRSMWAKWGDSPLPGTPGVVDELPSPPFKFVKPRPASSVPPPELLSRPSSVIPACVQPATTPVPQTEKQARRISMSTAKPGDETSTQTMQVLDFDASDEDDDNDETGDSREYLSAEEGYDSQSSDEEQDRPEEVSIAPSEASSHPRLQRKRSSMTSGPLLAAPVPEKQYRPSPLDDWNFDFSSRKAQRDVVSPGPFSSAASTSGASVFGGRSTPTRYHHHSNSRHGRRLSQESNQLFAYGVAAPNNTPDSPLPQRYDAVSPISGRAPNVERFTVTSLSAAQRHSEEQMEEAVETPHPRHNGPYFIVKRSANVVDEAANLIEYSTARVMSGGVKIGSILPRGVNGVIEEEEEDAAEMEVDFETSTPAAPVIVPILPQVTIPPHIGHLTMPAYPLGVPVPGYPQAMSSAPVASVLPQAMPLGSAVPTVSHVSSVGHHQSTSSARHFHQRPPLAVNAYGLHNAAHLSLPSPVTSTSGSQIHAVPVEYCGDFRTTGHCRFGARCRYSHDIAPHVRSSTSNAATRYRPSSSSVPTEPKSVSPRTAAVGIPPVPPGYQLSNVLPQPHHIPGVPLEQQPLSPFLFAHPSTIAHPLTSPAASAAANMGVKMANTEKATKILKSLGITPQQLLAHQPAPVVMADGEIMYDLTQGRSKGGVPLGRDPDVPFRTALRLDRNAMEARDMVLMRFGTEQEQRAVMGSSAGMVMEGEEEDIWTVSQGRKGHLTDEPGNSNDGQRRRSSQLAKQDPTMILRHHHASQPQQPYTVEPEVRQQPARMRSPASYSPVQHLHYPSPKQFQAVPPHVQYQQPHPLMPQYRHTTPMASSVTSVTPVTTPSPAPSAHPSGGSLTQEEVIKVLTALGLSVPGLTTPGHVAPAPANPHAYPPAQQPHPGSQPPQNPYPRYPSGPYDYTHPSMR